MPRVMIRRFCRAAMALGFAAALLALPQVLLGRAGGGEGYSGGHSSGGGGGHGGGDHGGGGDLIVQLLRLCIDYPKVGIPILLLVCGFFVYAYFKGKDSYQGSIIRKADAARDL